MIKKVIFVAYQPLTEKVKEDYYFNNLVESKIEIEYWDLSEIYFKNIEFTNNCSDEFVVKFNSLNGLEQNIRQQDVLTTLYLCNITFEYRSLSLYKIFSKYKCQTAFFARGALPSISLNSRLSKTLDNFKKALNIRSLFRFLLNKYAYLLKKWGVILPHKIIFRAGSEGLRTIGAGSNIELKYSNIIDVNSFDYDNYVITKNTKRLIEFKYCVYLDEYLPFHPDFKMLNIKVVNPSEFYNRINDFFNFLESEYQIKIVIAAHPKANNYRSSDYFCGRQVYFNKTAELVKDSEFILFHCSTSVSFAVLNGKPIFSLTSNSIKKDMPYYYDYINYFSGILGSKVVNIDQNFDLNLILAKPSPYKYQKFTYEYLTSDKSHATASSKIFIESIRSL